METWISLFLLFAIFTATTGENDFSNEVVVTSADVINGKIQNIGKAGESYRLYAVYGIGSDQAQVQQVIITDSKGTVFRLDELCGKAGAYFLAENHIVVAPLTVSDPTPLKQTRKRSVAFRLTYTIYLVSTRLPTLPVVDVVQSVPRIVINSDDYDGQETRGLTILSADAHFTLRQFKITTDSAYILPRGYDVANTKPQDSLMDLTQKNADSSYITIFGPIVTILNNDQKTGRFKTGFDPASTFGDLEPGSSLSLLSPNWLNLDAAYSTSFTSYSEAFDRQFNYGKDTQFDYAASVSSLNTGESIALEVTTEKGEVMVLHFGSSGRGDISGNAYGASLHLKASVPSLTSPTTYPRFLIRVTTKGTKSPGGTDTASSTTPKMESTTSGAEGASMTSLFAWMLFTFMIASY